MSKTIVINSTPTIKLVVELVGEMYEARAPKKALFLSLMMKIRLGGGDPVDMDNMLTTLLRKMFNKEDAELVKARLEDEDDELDVDHVMALANALIEAAIEGPTT